MTESYPIKINIKPYLGKNEEIFEGKKTIIKIYKDYFDYKIEYKKKEISKKCDNPGCKDCEHLIEGEEFIVFNKSLGYIEKKNIYTLTKYINTDYDEEDKPFAVHFLDIEMIDNTKGILTITGEDEKELVKLYNTLKNWHLNIIDNETEATNKG